MSECLQDGVKKSYYERLVFLQGDTVVIMSDWGVCWY